LQDRNSDIGHINCGPYSGDENLFAFPVAMPDDAALVYSSLEVISY